MPAASLRKRLAQGTGHLVATLLAIALHCTIARADDPVYVDEGSHRLIRTDSKPERVAIGNPSIADVESVSDSDVLLLGKRPGKTSLIVWLEEGPLELEIVVRPQDAEAPVEPDAQVQIDIKVVEVSRQLLRQAGVQLLRNTRGSAHAISPPGTLSGVATERGGSVSRASNGFVFSSASGFLPLSNAFQLVGADSGSGFIGIVSLLEANGFAQTLAEPSLVTTSGEPASFLAGGEFPIPVAQGGNGGTSISIEYREFGIRVTLLPTVVSPEHIVVKVSPEVSDLDFSAGVSVAGVAVPALTTRRAETTVELGDGESFVIGGLISRNLSSTAERVPFLGDLPVIGAFFRRSRYQRSDTELIMIVSPHLVEPLAREAPRPPLPGDDTIDFEPSNAELIFGGRVVPDPPGGTGYAP